MIASRSFVTAEGLSSIHFAKRSSMPPNCAGVPLSNHHETVEPWPRPSPFFASWARHSLHDKVLAERLAIINPTDFEDLAGLRRELTEVIDERLDELEIPPWVETDQQFYFVRSQIVVLDTGIQIKDHIDLRDWISDLSLGSIFYHFIDARRRPPHRRDDFSVWLETLDSRHGGLVRAIQNIDPFFTSLRQIRIDLKEILSRDWEG